MLLGLFSTIANAIGKAIGAVVGTIVEPVLRVLLSLISTLLSEFVLVILGALGKCAVDFIPILIKLVMDIIDLVFSCLKWKEKMANLTIDWAVDIYKGISLGDDIKMLGWSPIAFINSGRFENLDTSLSNPYFMALNLMKNGVMPTAMIIFALIVMIELFQITVRTEGMRNSGFESPFKLMLKVAICKILLDNTQLILEAISNTGLDLFNKLYSIATSFNTEDFKFEGAKKELQSVAWYVIIMLWGQMGLQYVFVKIIFLIIPFLVYGRVIEMYIMIVLSPIPFATFASQEFSQVGKNFVKQFIGISLKIVVMYIIILIYGLMMTIMGFSSLNTGSLEIMVEVIVNAATYGGWLAALGTFVIAIGFKPLLFSIMLLMSLMGSDKYVKQITGAWY